jgi:type II secretory pathway pseudopilin PulG
MMRSTNSPRGYTLIELMVALGTSLIVVTAGLTLAMAQQRTFQGTSRDRALQESARLALGAITGTLRLAGYGVDPALALDLGPQTKARMDGTGNAVYVTTAVPKGDGSACMGVCRDSTTGPDEIVFYTRDPGFGPHPLTVAADAASTALHVALVPGQTTLDLQSGQVLQVACYRDSQTWTYVTVNGAPTLNGDGTATIPITGTGQFPSTSLLADPCFSGVATMSGGLVLQTSMETAAKVFKIDRYHYYVQAYDVSGTARSWNTAGTRPYLMLEQGLKDSAGALIRTVVAPDVEDIQFAYVFPYDTVQPLVGATGGGALTNDDAGINLNPANGTPAYSDPTNPLSLTRQNHHPGNIRAVRVSVVVRSAVSDPALLDTAIPAAGNRDAVVGEAGYARMRVETTVRIPNLAAEGPSYPGYGAMATPGSRQDNVGGG